jgi:hypothetical protein
MTDAELEEYLDDEKEGLGPSLALPPLYVLRTAVRCPKCGKAQHVYALGCTAFHDAEDRDPIEQFHFLSFVHSIPTGIAAMLRATCPSYFLDRESAAERPYLMNHCGCGAKLDDDLLHGDVGAPFWPDTPEGYGQLMLFRLLITQAIPVECSYTLGGGEYLSFGLAEAW